MKQLSLTFFFVASLATEMWGACAYQDCGQYVLTHKLVLQQKIATTLKLTDANIAAVQSAYTEHTAALAEQNTVIEKLELATAANNLTLREIAEEQEKLAALLANQNALSAKKAEAIQSQSIHLSTITKIKAEDP